MSDTGASADPASVGPSNPAGEKSHPGRMWSGVNGISIAGLLFIYTSVCVFGAVTIKIFREVRYDSLVEMLPDAILTVIAAFMALLGVGLVRVAGLSASTPAPIMNPKEWATLDEQLKAGKEEPITQYIRLRSLNGFTGSFTKLGLQGLPLATIGLTIFFSLLYLKDAQYMDLVKLTLGAFIGSFVQKQIGANQPSSTVQLPSGEKLKVQPSPITIA